MVTFWSFRKCGYEVKQPRHVEQESKDLEAGGRWKRCSQGKRGRGQEQLHKAVRRQTR